MRFILARSIKKKKKICNTEWLFISRGTLDVPFSPAAFKEAQSQGYRTLRYLRKTCHLGLKVVASRELSTLIAGYRASSGWYRVELFDDVKRTAWADGTINKLSERKVVGSGWAEISSAEASWNMEQRSVHYSPREREEKKETRRTYFLLNRWEPFHSDISRKDSRAHESTDFNELVNILLNFPSRFKVGFISLRESRGRNLTLTDITT